MSLNICDIAILSPQSLKAVSSAGSGRTEQQPAGGSPASSFCTASARAQSGPGFSAWPDQPMALYTPQSISK